MSNISATSPDIPSATSPDVPSPTSPDVPSIPSDTLPRETFSTIGFSAPSSETEVKSLEPKSSASFLSKNILLKSGLVLLVLLYVVISYMLLSKLSYLSKATWVLFWIGAAAMIGVAVVIVDYDTNVHPLYISLPIILLATSTVNGYIENNGQDSSVEGLVGNTTTVRNTSVTVPIVFNIIAGILIAFTISKIE